MPKSHLVWSGALLIAGAATFTFTGCDQAPRTTAEKPAANEDAVATDPAVVAARQAMKSVGIDPAADKVWMAAINNAKIAAGDRSSLIEDLNEVGFKDPENPTLADMPKIKARLALIDQLAPKAIDDTNRAAFAEARKDLVDMAGKAKP